MNPLDAIKEKRDRAKNLRETTHSESNYARGYADALDYVISILPGEPPTRLELLELK